MSNFGLVSEWYPQDQIAQLLGVLEPGDLLEFNRNGYCHWGVYIGEFT